MFGQVVANCCLSQVTARRRVALEEAVPRSLPGLQGKGDMHLLDISQGMELRGSPRVSPVPCVGQDMKELVVCEPHGLYSSAGYRQHCCRGQFLSH